ncbi:polyprenyl synthetase family protein [Streptomyces sp. NK08204]|uniref:polyprenyl synthetase family protein n=1 Tax=Streptomyces sp. NK08204 TaxID=2873260 RepID=UPI001CEC7B75|nr:polyprenyl synthetase family protein [Streptomyces sp. NK08204]
MSVRKESVQDEQALILVVGSAASSDPARLSEAVQAGGALTRLLPHPDQLDPEWLAGVRTVELKADADVPQMTVQEVVERLAALGFTDAQKDAPTVQNAVVKLRPAAGPPARDRFTDGDPGDACDRLLARTQACIEDLLSAECSRWGAVDARAAAPVEAIAELVAAGGKLLRPTFCISGYLAAGGGTADEDTVVAASAGLELLQVFALVHDDVMDNSSARRGAPTVHVRHADLHTRSGWVGEHRRYGEGVAILTGDLALGYAHQLTRDLRGPAMEVWTELVTEVIIGQQLDIRLAAELSPDPDLARWVAVCKSGRYTVHRPLALGAAIAGRPELQAPFEEYGITAGEAFQLRDDLLDAFGDPAATGKPVGLDVSEHKMTLLLALGAAKDPRVARLVEEGRNRDWDPTALRDALLASGVRQDVEDCIDRLVAMARTALEGVPLAGDWQQRLSKLAEQVAYRER